MLARRAGPHRPANGETVMNRTEFEAALQQDGYQVVARTMQQNATNPGHAHDLNARVMVIAGEMTLDRDGVRHASRPGATFEIAHGERHAVIADPDGEDYIPGPVGAGDIPRRRTAD